MICDICECDPCDCFDLFGGNSGKTEHLYRVPGWQPKNRESNTNVYVSIRNGERSGYRGGDPIGEYRTITNGRGTNQQTKEGSRETNTSCSASSGNRHGQSQEEEDSNQNSNNGSSTGHCCRLSI